MNLEELTVVVENRIMSFPNLHDAEIVTVYPLMVDSEWQLKIDVVRDSLDNFRFDFFGVRNIICNTLHFQNVIYNVVVLSQQEIFSDLEKYKAFFGLDSDGHLKQFVSDVEEKKLMLVEFSPSNGMELIIVCREMRVYEGA